jgi:tRNA A37 threonylcarbamoyladenosine biosynthesis protein TsaE
MDDRSVLFVEWADRGIPGDFSETWRIRFRYEDEEEDEGRRVLSFSAQGARAEKALKSFLGKLKERKKI